MRGRVLIALAVVAALAGCQESGFDESKETQRPLKVQHALDPLTGTKVPGLAERPMTLSVDTLGDTLALGVQPVRAALPGGRVPDYMRTAARGVEVVPPLTELDLAATDAAEPDLILGTKEGDGDLYDDLSRIAPDRHERGRRLEAQPAPPRRGARPHQRCREAPDRLGQPRGEGQEGAWRARTVCPRCSLEPTPFAESILADLGVEPGTRARRAICASIRRPNGPAAASSPPAPRSRTSPTALALARAGRAVPRPPFGSTPFLPIEDGEA